MNYNSNGTGDWWELEQAFAEDTSGNQLGGYVWPPRCYSCSFCKREFKSAQALGGHMNVHRRDKAILKQFPNSITPPSTLHHSQMMNHTCTNFLYNELNPHHSLPYLEPSDIDHSVPALSFTRVSPSSSTPSITSSSFVADQRKILNDRILDHDHLLIKNKEIKRSMSIFETKLALSTSLNNLFVCTRTRDNTYSSDEELELVASCCKRRKLSNEKQVLDFLPKMVISTDVERRCCQQSEELDLELRLGGPAPKVK